MLSSTRWEKYSRERSLESLHPHGRRYLIEWSNRMSETTYCTYNFQRLINLVVRDTKVIDLQDRSKRRTETKIEVFLFREYEKISLRMNSRWTESIIENSARILSVRFLAVFERAARYIFIKMKSPADTCYSFALLSSCIHVSRDWNTVIFRNTVERLGSGFS